MEFSLKALLLITVWAGSAFTNGIWNCPFNTLCTCTPLNQHYPFTDNSLAIIKDVSCIGVSFHRTPELPSINMSTVRIVGSGLEVIERESLRNAKIKQLLLDNNKIIIISEYAFEGTGDMLSALDLSYNNLLEIPVEALTKIRNLTWLNLDSNKIQSMKVYWKNLSNTLTTLFLGRNGISHLSSHSDHSLSNFRMLTWLTLDGNFLTSIDSQALPYQLNVLNLARNIFKAFPSPILTSLSGLSNLDLRDNYIANISSTTLAKRPKLDKLDLGKNEISMLDNPFGGSLHIKDFYLDNNILKTLPANAFKGLNCNKIFLSHNKLDVINDQSFYAIGNSLEYLDLGHNLFSKAPNVFSQLQKLKYLSLSSNQIRKLPDDLFPPAAELVSLDLSNNSFTFVPKKALRPLKALSHINFNYNKISEINETSFYEWGENLKVLEMMNNGITSISENAIGHFKELKEINLSFNDIVTLGDKSFAHLSEKLESLEISFGLKFENFPEAAIKPLRSLVWLSLDHNKFKNVTRTALYNFGSIKYINLEGNKLQDIPDTFFLSNVHKNLYEVRLSFNKLKILKPFIFSGLKMIENILLNDNEITHISANAFQNLESNGSLTIILSENKISSLAPMAFVNIPKLIKLDLHGNLLKSFSLNVFQNISSVNRPMLLNLSRNLLTTVTAFNTMNTFIYELDLSHNFIYVIPIDNFFSLNITLKKLHMSHNLLKSLSQHQFTELTLLEELDLSNNLISKIRPLSFSDLKHLQILDLSRNKIGIIHSGQFKNLDELRILDLSYNSLKSIPNDAFDKTKLEHLTLAHNELFVAPTAPLIVVSYTLRQLDLSYNHIEHIDSSTFASTPFLTHLNLCYNRLTFIPNNILRSIVSLVSFGLCGNRLQVNFGELFHSAQSLLFLNLADTGLKITPVLTLANLAYLNLSHNLLAEIEMPFINYLPNLRSLDLSNNNLTSLNGITWNYTEKLEYLDVSDNPIKIITRDSFKGLENLKELNVQNLHSLERFDTNTLSDSKFITSLKIQTWPDIEKYRFRLERILSKLKLLKKLSILVTEETLYDQLGHGLSRKLRYLEITGNALTFMDKDCLAGIESTTQLTLHIHHTNIEEFPVGFFSKFSSEKLSLDLRNNKLRKFGPELFYLNPAKWKEAGTKKISGGINVADNPLECSCQTAWFGYWLRRHLHEIRNLSKRKLEISQQEYEKAKEAVCYMKKSNVSIPLIKYEDDNCNVQSRAMTLQTNSCILIIILYFLLIC